MNDVAKRFSWLSVYAIAMAFLEAVVVVYIRGLLHTVQSRPDLGPYAALETWREASTIVMLVAVGWLTGKARVDRFAYGMFGFALWDIWYYIWLRVLVGWPATLLDWDTLFLIPLPWRGPVLSPVLIAALICVLAVFVVVRVQAGEAPRLTLLQGLLMLCGALLALYVFMEGAIRVWLGGGRYGSSLQNEVFNWPLFLVAFLLMAVPGTMAFWPARPRLLRRGSFSR